MYFSSVMLLPVDLPMDWMAVSCFNEHYHWHLLVNLDGDFNTFKRNFNAFKYC